MRTITAAQRRRAMVRRHHLAGDADGPEAVTAALLALHATDPATVYLSVLVRSARCTLGDVAEAMYTRRTLVRWMAMRRTLFVFSPEDIALIQAAVSTPLAAALRRRLIARLRRNGTEPAIGDDVERWLAELEDRVARALARRGSATGAELATEERALATTILARAPSERPQNLTSSLLTVMSADGRLVRSVPVGPWTSRQHRWEPTTAWWPDGLPQLGRERAQRELVRRWLERFGPATVEDVQWWTGWNATDTRRALAGLAIEDVDLHGRAGVALAGTVSAELDGADAEPTAALLPALDPTPMGWKGRDWFMAVDPRLLFDRAGNIGPTVWWDGEIVGAWTVAADGQLRTRIVADRGAQARRAVERAAAQLHARLEGAVVTPAVRTPLERALTQGAAPAR